VELPDRVIGALSRLVVMIALLSLLVLDYPHQVLLSPSPRFCVREGEIADAMVLWQDGVEEIQQEPFV